MIGIGPDHQSSVSCVWSMRTSGPVTWIHFQKWKIDSARISFWECDKNNNNYECVIKSNQNFSYSHYVIVLSTCFFFKQIKIWWIYLGSVFRILSKFKLCISIFFSYTLLLGYQLSLCFSGICVFGCLIYTGTNSIDIFNWAQINFYYDSFTI